jgi:hypothetical protein
LPDGVDVGGDANGQSTAAADTAPIPVGAHVDSADESIASSLVANGMMMAISSSVVGEGFSITLT